MTSETMERVHGATPAQRRVNGWKVAAARRARRVFAGLYCIALMCLLWCALPMPNPFGAMYLMPAIVAAQVLGAMALLGWLLAWPTTDGS